METWTIQKLLNWVTQYLTDKSVDSPRLSSELILSHILSLKRIELYTNFDRIVEQDKLAQLRDMVRRAGLHEPVAYLVGKTEFYSIEIEVNNQCLIPRPETELLVERAVEFLRGRRGNQITCDLCTGSGCIAIAIAKNFPNTHIVATDISSQALEIAARNIEKHNLKERITLLQGDLFDPIMPYLDKGKFDLITCNPPYVSSNEYEKLDKNVKDYEPSSALLAGDEGLDIYNRIAEKAIEFIKNNGALILEIGYAQGSAVQELLENKGGFPPIKIEKDHNNNDRIVTAFMKPPENQTILKEDCLQENQSPGINT